MELAAHNLAKTASAPIREPKAHKQVVPDFTVKHWHHLAAIAAEAMYLLDLKASLVVIRLHTQPFILLFNQF